MDQIKLWILGLVWGGVIFSAVTGRIYSARFSMRREDNVGAFWKGFALYTAMAGFATYCVIWLWKP